MTPLRPSAAFTLLVACAALATPAAALVVATMVADIGTEPPIALQDFFLAPRDGRVVLGGSAYFYFDDGIHGLELWKSDGTALGTKIVKDICPGICGARWLSSYLALAASPQSVYFAADDGVHGQELWRTDGTEVGTLLVRDVLPGAESSQPRELFMLNGLLLFWADDGVHGWELWRSDGTAAETALVADLNLGPGSSSRGPACALGEVLFFGGAGGGGLWRTDGTAPGTALVAAITLPPQNWVANAPFVCLEDRLVFRGDDADGMYDPGLWASDGTGPGTQQLAAFDFSAAASDGARVFLVHRDVPDSWLWQTDGTPAGTVATPLPSGLSPSSGQGRLAVLGNVLFFVGWDDAAGAELWRFADGAFDLVVDLNPGLGDGFPLDSEMFVSGNGPFMTTVGDRLVFLADDGVHGLELWASDGSIGSAVPLGELSPGPESARPDFGRAYVTQTLLPGLLLYRWRDADGWIFLARTDGTPGGTAAVTPLRSATSLLIAPDPPAALFASNDLRCFAPLATGVLFSADDGVSGAEPWFSDGTAAGTHRIADASPGAIPSVIAACSPVGGAAVMVLSPGGDAAVSLVETTGVEGSLLELIPLETQDGVQGDSDVFQERVVFAADWLPVTDGTVGGTSLLDPDDLGIHWEVESSGDILFTAGVGLSVTDGSPGGLVDLLTSEPDWTPAPVRLTRFDGGLLFFAWAPDSGEELWRTDGTVEGTVPVADIRPGVAPGIPWDFPSYHRRFLTDLVSLGAVALFAADDGVHGEELWRTDGSAGGTWMVADLFPGAYPSTPRELTRAGDLVLFSAEAPGSGRELWASDGTAAGTRRVADLVPGAGSSVPQELAAIRDELWFSAWTPSGGREPWRARRLAGNQPELEPLGDLAPGPLSSSPLIFRAVGADVYTVANDNVHGFELWKIRDPDLLFADGFESSATALWSLAAP